MRGEESALPPRDRGPAKRFIRNYIDERKSVTEYFLIIILFVLMLTIIPIPAVQLAAVAIMYSSMIFITLDGFLLSKRIKKMVKEQFPSEPTRGVGMYGWMRATQLRRLRAPAPQVSVEKKKK
jgi:hypothetical protein